MGVVVVVILNFFSGTGNTSCNFHSLLFYIHVFCLQCFNGTELIQRVSQAFLFKGYAITRFFQDSKKHLLLKAISEILS